MLTRMQVLVVCALLAVVAAGASRAAEEEKLPIPDNIKLGEAVPRFDSRATLSNLQSHQNIAELARKSSVMGPQSTAFGFAAKSDEARTFVIGSLFSEAMACVQGGRNADAAVRLKAIEQEFIVMGVSPSLYNYITKVRSFVETSCYPKEVLVDFLSLFQPFFEDYLQSRSADRLTLFRAGSWLSDLAIVANAGDRGLLRQPQQLGYFTREMARMDAPKGVQDSFAEIGAIVGKPDITDRETARIASLAKNIQTLLE